MLLNRIKLSRPAIRVSIVGILVALLTACGVQPPNRQGVAVPLGETGMVGVTWSAFAIDGVDEVLRPRPSLRWVTSAQVTGSGGCNAFSGDAVFSATGVRIGPLSPVGKSCLTLPGGQEDKFFRALELTRKVRLESGQLVLQDDAGAPLARLVRAP